LIFTVFTSDIEGFNKVLMRVLNRYGKYFINRQHTTNTTVFQYSRQYLAKSETRVRGQVTGGIENVKLDRLDFALLKVLSNNARASYYDIARKLKTSPQVIRYRIRRLFDKGVITGFHITVNLEKLGLEYWKAFVYLEDMTEKRLGAIRNYCSQLPNCIFHVECIGPWNLEPEFEIEGHARFYEEMNRMRNAFPEISSYESVCIISEPKFDFIQGSLPAFSV
jgi:DNA-binding Lrp family transcriptional regulator